MTIIGGSLAPGVLGGLTEGTGGSSPTFPTTPTPPTTGKKIGFVRILGSASTNAGSSLAVPITSNVRGGRYVVVFTTGQRTTAHGTTAQIVTNVTDSVGTSYTIRTTAHSSAPQFLAVGHLATPLLSGGNVTVTWTRAMVTGAGNTVIVFECFGLTTFLNRTRSTVNAAYKNLTLSWTPATPTGALVIGLLSFGYQTPVTFAVGATWVKRIQTRYNGGRLTPTSATEWLTDVIATRWYPGTPRNASISWTPGGYLSLWAFAP